MDSAHRGNESSANLFLKPFDIRMEFVTLPDTIFSIISGLPAASSSGLGVVEGGNPLGYSDSGKVVLVSQQYGKGQVLAGLIAEAFTAQRMGYPNTIPTKIQIDRYENVYWLYSYLTNDSSQFN